MITPRFLVPDGDRDTSGQVRGNDMWFSLGQVVGCRAEGFTSGELNVTELRVKRLGAESLGTTTMKVRSSCGVLSIPSGPARPFLLPAHRARLQT